MFTVNYLLILMSKTKCLFILHCSACRVKALSECALTSLDEETGKQKQKYNIRVELSHLVNTENFH